MMDKDRFQTLVEKMYSTVEELEQMFPESSFPLDGHLVGSMGECLVADAYGLKLLKASNKGFDAVTEDGLQVEIKTTQSTTKSKKVGFRHKPEHSIIVKLHSDGSFDEIYNGPGSLIWNEFDEKKRPSNGQYQISINRIRMLNEDVAASDTLPRVD